MKVLVFDVDKSLSSIGGEADILKATGGLEPFPIHGGVMQVKTLLSRLYERKVVEKEHPIFKYDILKVTEYIPTPLCVEMGLDGIVIDTISTLFVQDKRILEHAKGGGADAQLELQDWGKLERMYSQLMSMINGLPCFKIVTSHAAYDKNQATGAFHYHPDLAGSSKGTIQRYFDCIFYTKVQTALDKKRVYTWITQPENQKFAKDRLGKLKPAIAQDYIPVIQSYQEAGFNDCKILIVGESGTGKTHSLITLNK